MEEEGPQDSYEDGEQDDESSYLQDESGTNEGTDDTDGITNIKIGFSYSIDKQRKSDWSDEDDESEWDGSSSYYDDEEEDEEGRNSMLKKRSDDTDQPPPKVYPVYKFRGEAPHSVDSILSMIDPDREVGFNEQIELLNKQLANIQHEICMDHKERQLKKVKVFTLEKKLIKEAVSEAGILYLPGNFLDPITGRRIEDKDLPVILEALKELPEATLKGFNFAYNKITDDGIALLAPFIHERASIIHLNLSHNDFTANGLYTLVTQLIGRASLQSLKLTGVKVGDEGINSITCLYMCGKGPRDLDISETDLTTPGFQALCSAFQAVDDDEDFPKFLTKYKLPFTLETLARLKLENHEFLKSQTYHRLCHSQFELIPPREKDLKVEELNQQLQEEHGKQHRSKEKNVMGQGLATALENALATTFLGGGDTLPQPSTDLNREAEMSIEMTEKAKDLPSMDGFIEARKNLKDKDCKSTRADGRPIIVCPSLYSLELDEDYDEDNGGELFPGKGTHLKKANPMYMDSLVETPQGLGTEQREASGKDAVDNLTATKSSVKFVRDVFKEAGTVAGISDFSSDSDKAQLLLITILDTAKTFLQAESEGDSGVLTLAELKMIWDHSLQTTVQIFRPSVPPHCKITDETMDIFVEEFMKISSGTFYKLIQVPFFQDMFQNAATKGCIDRTHTKKEQYQRGNSPNENDTSMQKDYVRKIVLKFLEGVIVRAGEIVGGGDPYNLRGTASLTDETEGLRSSIGQDQFASIMELSEETVRPLVDQLFEAGGMMANDALECKEESETSQNEGIEPAKQYLEGIFGQLTNFLYQMKDDDQKLAERMEKPPKKFTFSTKPVRLVLNRPFFSGQERVLASKLATYLRNNDSVQCLHLRKWGLCEDGTVNLMHGIITNMNIVTLDLSMNGIGTEGVQVIAEYMKRNQNLKHLLLNHNRLRNPGMIALAGAIPESGLNSLNVAYNDTNEGGLNPLLEAIAKSDIYSLYVLGNCFSQTTCDLLTDLFESRSLNQPDCDVQVQDVDGEKFIGINSQARDINEWYEVPVKVDVELVCPPYFNEHYTPPKVSIFGAVDVEV